MERLSKAEKKSEALKKINEVDLLTFGPGTLTAQGQSLVHEIIKEPLHKRWVICYN